jgi:hypothetical protein
MFESLHYSPKTLAPYETMPTPMLKSQLVRVWTELIKTEAICGDLGSLIARQRDNRTQASMIAQAWAQWRPPKRGAAKAVARNKGLAINTRIRSQSCSQNITWENGDSPVLASDYIPSEYRYISFIL